MICCRVAQSRLEANTNLTSVIAETYPKPSTEFWQRPRRVMVDQTREGIALPYFIDSVELIPEFIPVFSDLDDVVLLLLVPRLPRKHVARCRAWRDQVA